MGLAGYDHLLRAADRLRWDDGGLDLAGDAPAWRALAPELRARLERLVAGFCVAEAAVAEHLAPFEAAAPDERLAACFAAQADDEARHARLFRRVATEVMGVDGVRDARALAGPALCELFEGELPARAASVAAGGGLPRAVGLYHLVLEGVAFTGGQEALIGLLVRAGTLPAVLDGARRVQADERWHLGLGVACLREAGAAEDLGLEAPLRLAAACWGDAAGDALDANAVLARHHRRLELVATPRRRMA